MSNGPISKGVGTGVNPQNIKIISDDIQDVTKPCPRCTKPMFADAAETVCPECNNRMINLLLPEHLKGKLCKLVGFGSMAHPEVPDHFIIISVFQCGGYILCFEPVKELPKPPIGIHVEGEKVQLTAKRRIDHRIEYAALKEQLTKAYNCEWEWE